MHATDAGLVCHDPDVTAYVLRIQSLLQNHRSLGSKSGLLNSAVFYQTIIFSFLKFDQNQPGDRKYTLLSQYTIT